MLMRNLPIILLLPIYIGILCDVAVHLIFAFVAEKNKPTVGETSIAEW
jgi:hypothetical protein